MKVNFTRLLLLISCLCGLSFAKSQAQDLSGAWLGITYFSDPNQPALLYKINFTQSGNQLSGTSESARLNGSFGNLAYISGQLSGNQVSYNESDQSGGTTVKDACFWRVSLTYDPANESLVGTYEHIINGTTCTKSESGRLELYRVVPKSPTKFCKDSPINLTVTGKNIQWYPSVLKIDALAKGNTYSPKITQTTTFYITQTLYNIESPSIPITVEITDASFTATTTNPGCGQKSGVITLSSAGSGDWQYSLNGGLPQISPLFNGLGPGSYTVTASNSTGCRAEQTVTLSNENAPTISNLTVTAPHCESANGEVSIAASGGQSPLTYSINYGVSFQISPTFRKLAGGTYTLRVRDANGCEVNKAVSIPAFVPMIVQSTTGSPTTCGQANGQLTITTSGGNDPVQYSIDAQTYQLNNTFTALKAGQYTVTVRDKIGCTISERIVVGDSPGPPPVDVFTLKEDCGQQNGAILITSSQSSSGLTYSIDGQTFQSTSSFPGLRAGTYTLTLKDTNSCKTTQNVVIAMNCANTIHIPTAFSPNNDRQNDALTVHFAFTSLTVARFTVYDRWGAVLYNRANFALTNGESIWDGQIDGQSAPTGVYVYQLECQFPDGTQSSYHESVALLNK